MNENVQKIQDWLYNGIYKPPINVLINHFNVDGLIVDDYIIKVSQWDGYDFPDSYEITVSHKHNGFTRNIRMDVNGYYTSTLVDMAQVLNDLIELDKIKNNVLPEVPLNFRLAERSCRARLRTLTVRSIWPKAVGGVNLLQSHLDYDLKAFHEWSALSTTSDVSTNEGALDESKD